MQLFDAEVPSSLLLLQQWFASIITRPLNDENQMVSTSPTGRPMTEEATDFILPNPKLSSAQRIQIYNQQYWWRLLTTLHENFPTLIRLFGYADFNHSIGTPFLSRYPSRHWSLANLGSQLTSWIKNHYFAPDKLLVLSAAEVDWAYQELFTSPPSSFLSPSLDLLSKKIGLQSHLKLFKFPFDLFAFRTNFLKENVQFWMESEFPNLPKDKNYFFLLYRDAQNLISYKEIEEGEWSLLHLISNGFSIEQACDRLEKTKGIAFDQAQSSIGKWVQSWVRENWLTTGKNV